MTPHNGNRPRLGDLVLFYNGVHEPAVAMVTQVHSESTVNLCVFPGYGSPTGYSSVTYSDSPEEGRTTWRHLDA